MPETEVTLTPQQILSEFIRKFGWDASLITLSKDETTIDMYSFDESDPPRTFHGLKVVQHV